MKVQQEFYSSDEEFQAMLGKYRIDQPKLTCSGGKPIQRMCINSSCLNKALICNEPSCTNCNKHLVCPLINFNGVHHLLTSMVEKQKMFALDVYKI